MTKIIIAAPHFFLSATRYCVCGLLGAMERFSEHAVLNVPLNSLAGFTNHLQRTRVTLNDDVVNFCHIICHFGKWLLKMQKLLFFQPCQISTPQEIFLTIRVRMYYSSLNKLKTQNENLLFPVVVEQQFWWQALGSSSSPSIYGAVIKIQWLARRHDCRFGFICVPLLFFYNHTILPTL